MNKEQEDELLKAMRSLLSDIEAMQDTNLSDMFGSFSEWSQHTDGNISIEWGNLAISAENLQNVLTKIGDQKRGDTPPYWHQQNPWKDELVYVPIEELADCALSRVSRRTKEDVLEQWSEYGIWLDAYILPDPGLTAGVRFGPEGADYLSPGFYIHKLEKLLEKHRAKP